MAKKAAPTGAYPTIESVKIERTCRRYRMVPLEAFVKGHPTVVSRATTKVFDGYKKKIRQKLKPKFLAVFPPVFGSYIYIF